MKKYFTSQDARTLTSVYDFAIFPVHGVKEDGTCTCGVANCTNVGKHPATTGGFKDASNDIEEIKKFWGGRKFLNVGIATGKASGISVIDVDNDKALALLKEKLGGTLPETLKVKTGRGYHFYFQYEEGLSSKNNILPGIDVKSDGGYVIGPLSNHSNGKVYEFCNPLESLVKFPKVIKDLMEAGAAPKPLLTPPRPQLSLLTNGWTKEQRREHLNHIDPDCDYDTWIKIGMALHEDGASFDLWDEWSQRGSKYDGTTQSHWRSFHSGGGVTYGTVVALAKQGGWRGRENAQNRAKSHGTENKEEKTDGSGTEAKKENSFYYINGPDIKFEPASNDFVQGLLSESALSVVYGESNCGKTFFMTDLAFHITQGKRWREKRVNKGAVLYLCLEGAYGIKGRIQAYKQENNTDLNGFLLMPCAVNFMNPEVDVPQLKALIDKAKEEHGSIKMVIVDTLARALSGADENSGQDMGALVANADYIRNSTGAHVCFIHHSGKDRALGARGHSSLRAAVDTEIEIHRSEIDDYSTVKIVKQREMEPLEDMAFSLKSVTIGTNQYMEEIKSCIVQEAEIEETIKDIRLTAMETLVFDAFIFAIDTYGVSRIPEKDMGQKHSITYEEFYKGLEHHGYKELYDKDGDISSKNVKSATNSVRSQLKKKNKIGFNKDYLWLIS